MRDVDELGEDIELTVEEQLELSIKKSEENWDKYLRTAAELDNVRKRASRDIENARKFALENTFRVAKQIIRPRFLICFLKRRS